MQLEEHVLDLLHCFIKHILKEIIYKTILKVKSRKYNTVPTMKKNIFHMASRSAS